jgi:polysaccharide pyruvyl transferase WcaK-like protein
MTDSSTKAMLRKIRDMNDMGDDPDGDLDDQIVTLKRVDRSTNPHSSATTVLDHAVFQDTTSLPKIGRLIHVRGYDKCRAAIVTGEGFITIFAPNLKPQESVLIAASNGWHYVDECTD